MGSSKKKREIREWQRERGVPYMQAKREVEAREAATDIAALGDPYGPVIGTVQGTSEVRLCPGFASQQNRLGSTAVLGAPGSGRTMLLAWLATQSAIAGRSAIAINPKPLDRLDGLLDVAEAAGVATTWERCGTSPGSGPVEQGYLDPFRHLPPEQAGPLAARLLRAVFSTWDADRLAHLDAAMDVASRTGAGSMGAVIEDYAEDPSVVRDVLHASEKHLGLGAFMSLDRTPPSAPPHDGTFMSLIDVPFTDDLALRTVMFEVIVAIAMRRLTAAGGGTLAMFDLYGIDLKVAAPMLLRTLRQCRSVGVEPAFSTEDPGVLFDTGISDYLDRVFVGRFTNDDSALAHLLGAEAPEGVIDSLHDLGPKRQPDGTVRAPRMWHRDLNDKVGLVEIMPGRDLLRAMATPRR